MSRLGPTREWPPVNPLEALLHPKESQIGRRPKVAIVAAHLCDIVAAAGGHLGRWNIAAIVHATLPRSCADTMRELAGVAFNIFCSLGYRRQEAPAHLVHLTADVGAVLEQARPDIVVTQAYEGGDCDRDAVAFAVHHAIQPLKPPVIVEMTGWNAATGVRSLGEFLPRPGVSERGSRLTSEEQARKAVMLAAFPELRDRVPALDLHVERFRMAPRYDFTQPPHPGPLFYEQAGGRWTGESWRLQVVDALPQLAGSTSGEPSPVEPRQLGEKVS